MVGKAQLATLTTGGGCGLGGLGDRDIDVVWLLYGSSGTGLPAIAWVGQCWKFML
jgi:hypothetical protein